MEQISPWWSILTTMFGLWIGYRLGYRQATIAAKSLSLSVTKAIPKVGTTVKIDKRQENSTAFPPFYYLVATIYNEGELPAQKLQGVCRLFSPINESQKQSIPISQEFLRSTPYELNQSRLDGIFIDAERPQNARFKIEIEFSYTSPADEQTHHYSAQYEYKGVSGKLEKTPQ